MLCCGWAAPSSARLTAAEHWGCMGSNGQCLLLPAHGLGQARAMVKAGSASGVEISTTLRSTHGHPINLSAAACDC